MQFVNEAHHSTEMAILCIFNVLLSHLDKGNAILMGLLDLSAAFDTIWPRYSHWEASGNARNRRLSIGLGCILPIQQDHASDIRLYSTARFRSRSTVLQWLHAAEGSINSNNRACVQWIHRRCWASLSRGGTIRYSFSARTHGNGYPWDRLMDASQKTQAEPW